MLDTVGMVLTASQHKWVGKVIGGVFLERFVVVFDFDKGLGVEVRRTMSPPQSFREVEMGRRKCPPNCCLGKKRLENVSRQSFWEKRRGIVSPIVSPQKKR